MLLVAVAGKLMGLVLLTTFTLLLFSAAVSALSYLYMDEDLAFLLPLPLPRRGLRAQRAMEAALNAGTMVALLLAPVTVAYWSLSEAPPWTLLLSWGALGLYLCVPLSLGIVVTVLLARFFPARRLHQLLTVLSLVMVCLLIVLFRVARPEALLSPDSSSQVLDILRSIRMPQESRLPSTWLADVVVRSAEGEWGQVWPALGRLAALAALCLALAAGCLKVFHWKGYGRAQEQQDMRPGGIRKRIGKVLLDLLVAPAPAGPQARAILRRDALLFFRDPTQWGQLIILAALVVIYLFNVRYMPEGVAIFKVAVSFWNLATLGLIVSSVAGRFAFTAVGSEGKAYFASRVLPLEVWPYLWAKYLFTAVPLSALSALTLYGSNRFLGVEGKALALFGVSGRGRRPGPLGAGAVHGKRPTHLRRAQSRQGRHERLGPGLHVPLAGVCECHSGVFRPSRLPVLPTPPRQGSGSRLRTSRSQCGRPERPRGPGLSAPGGSVFEADGGKVRKARRDERDARRRGESEVGVK